MPIRLTGGVSGLDIDNLVKQLMKAERAPLDKLKQKKQYTEWQRDDYRDMNLLLSGLRESVQKMKYQSTFLTKKASSTDEAVLSATGTANAVDGTYTLKVDRLASAATLTSGKITPVSAANPTGKGDLSAKVGYDTTLTIGGEKGSVTIQVNKDDSMSTLISTINSKTKYTGVQVNYDAALDRLFFVSSTTGKGTKIELSSENQDLLTKRLALPGAASSKTAQDLYIGTKSFSVTTQDSDGKDVVTYTSEVLIDKDLIGDKTLRIHFNDKDYDFTINNQTTLRQLMDEINRSDLGKAGVKASMDEKGTLNFMSPSDLTFNGDVLDKLGLENLAPDVNHKKVTLSAENITGSRAYTVTSKDKDGNDVVTVVDSLLINDKLEGDQKLKIAYNGKDYEFTISKNTTIRQLMDSINTSDLGKAGVTVSLDKDGKLKFFNPDQSKKLEFKGDPSSGTDIVETLGLKSVKSEKNLEYFKVSGTPGDNAKVTYNGVTSEDFASNTFSISGVSFSVKKVGEASVTITQDVDSVFNSIKSFIEKYNEVIEKINKKTTEKKNRDYQPLTDDQRESLSEEQIKKWEEKAKSGTLRGDDLLTSLLSNMRNDISNYVTSLGEGELKQISQLGIVTGDYTERGKLYIKDEDALRKAIANNPDQVMRLFNFDDPSGSMVSGDGIATRMYDRLNDVMKQITKKAGSANAVSDDSAMAKELSTINLKIYNLSKTMDSKEDRYYKKFAAMEKALSQLNSQTSSITSLLQQNYSK